MNTMLQNINRNQLDEEEAEMELWIAHQMEQELQDQHDLRPFRGQKQEEESEVCPGHEYEFLEQLDSNEDYVRELWNCLICNKTRVFTKRRGVRD
jgi:hypothetical protein